MHRLMCRRGINALLPRSMQLPLPPKRNNKLEKLLRTGTIRANHHAGVQHLPPHSQNLLEELWQE